MKVTLEIEKNRCIVEKETGDRRLTRSGFQGTDPDSIFFHHVKKELQKQGYDVIKKRMQKDGHLYGSESTQYVRSRSKKAGIMVYDGDYALRFAFEEFNKNGKVILLADTY